MLADLLNSDIETLDGRFSKLQVLGGAPIGLAITSLAGSLQYANDAFGRFFDVNVAAQRDADISQITRGMLGEDFLIPVARGGGQRQVSISLDANRTLLCTAARVMHGAFPIYVALVVQDISDIASEHRGRWRMLREQIGAHGICGVWNWTMPIANAGDICGNFIAWITAVDDLFGTGCGPRTFKDLMQHMAPYCRERVAAEVARAVETRSGYAVDYQLMFRDGSIRHMRSVGCYLEGTHPPGGRLVGMELELRAEQSDEHRMGVCRTTLERMDVPVVSIDRRLRYRYFNPAFAALADSASDDVPQVDQPVLNSVADPARRRRLADVLARVMKGESSIFESEYFDARGEVCQWIDFHFKPTFGASGAIDGAIGVGYDLSPLKRANQSHQYLNAQLRQRLEHRAAKIDAANRDLSNRVAIACEALRDRLQGIKALVGTSAGEASNGESPQQVLAALGNMEAQLADLETLSRVALHRPERRKIDMNRLLREVLRDLEFMLEGRTVHFDIGTLPHVVADRKLVKQVVLNLLSNAIKFTRGCATAHIRVAATVEDGTTVWSVTDNGIGFDAKYADEMFSAFVRRGTKPRGAGLSIAWRAIQQLSGRLWCESSPGQGATFRFTIGDQEQRI